MPAEATTIISIIDVWDTSKPKLHNIITNISTDSLSICAAGLFFINKTDEFAGFVKKTCIFSVLVLEYIRLINA